MTSVRSAGQKPGEIHLPHREQQVSAVFRPISVRNSSSAAVRSDKSADSIDEPIISRSEVWETPSFHRM
jgi:hypothetical protein